MPRRLAALLYESLLVAGLVLLLAALFPGAATGTLSRVARTAMFASLVVAVCGYFVWLWSRGQTLAMKAWRLHLVDDAGRAIGWRRALARFAAAAVPVALALGAALWLIEQRDSLVAWLALVPAALNFGWPLADSKRRCLHDVIAGTRLVVSAAPPSTSSPSPRRGTPGSA